MAEPKTIVVQCGRGDFRASRAVLRQLDYFDKLLNFADNNDRQYIEFDGTIRVFEMIYEYLQYGAVEISPEFANICKFYQIPIERADEQASECCDNERFSRYEWPAYTRAVYDTLVGPNACPTIPDIVKLLNSKGAFGPTALSTFTVYTVHKPCTFPIFRSGDVRQIAMYNVNAVVRFGSDGEVDDCIAGNCGIWKFTKAAMTLIRGLQSPFIEVKASQEGYVILFH